MENLGFIRDELDVKLLILYILDRLPSPVEPLVLSDLVLFDGGFTWFDYCQCLSKLLRSEHVSDEGGKYAITEKGRRNILTVENSLPYSVRAKADRLAAPVAATMRRSSMLETDIVPLDREGNHSVSLRMCDDKGEIFSLRLTAPDEETATLLRDGFTARAEEIYNKILSLLSEGEKS